MTTLALVLAAAAETPALTGDLINILLGGGAVGTITIIAKVAREFRESSGRRQDGAVADLEKWRRNSDNAREREAARADYEASMGQYWRDWAGTLEHVIRIDLAPDKLPTQPPMPLPRPTYTTADAKESR